MTLGTVRRVSVMLRLRPLVVGTALVVVLGGCADAGGPQAAPSPTAAVDAAAVNDAMAAVADARRVAAEQVDAELRAAVRIEPLAMSLRSPSGVDTALEEVPQVAALLDRADPATGGEVLDGLDEALTAAEDAIGATAAQVEAGSWQEQFLTAQGEVLGALETWSVASRDVHDTVLEHWELWETVVSDAAVLAEDRWRYRTEEEAAGTWEIEVQDDLDALSAAAAAIATAADARDEAATAVVAADERAAEVFADRPTEATSPPASP